MHACIYARVWQPNLLPWDLSAYAYAARACIHVWHRNPCLAACSRKVDLSSAMQGTLGCVIPIPSPFRLFCSTQETLTRQLERYPFQSSDMRHSGKTLSDVAAMCWNLSPSSRCNRSGFARGHLATSTPAVLDSVGSRQFLQCTGPHLRFETSNTARARDKHVLACSLIHIAGQIATEFSLYRNMSENGKWELGGPVQENKTCVSLRSKEIHSR